MSILIRMNIFTMYSTWMADSLPEICVWKYMTYIFKYDAEEDAVHLWT